MAGHPAALPGASSPTARSASAQPALQVGQLLVAADERAGAWKSAGRDHALGHSRSVLSQTLGDDSHPLLDPSLLIKEHHALALDRIELRIHVAFHGALKVTCLPFQVGVDLFDGLPLPLAPG